ncbi:MAG: HAD-IA family hydrolase [Planctomycetes bacterium]|nr:HAD-IA family hydrolase [Planctomycetota bacterium]
MEDGGKKLKAVILDMDGVLCDSEPFICQAARMMLAERYGVAAAPDDFIPFVGAGENRYIGGVGEKFGLKMDIESDKKRTYEIYLDIIKGRLRPVAGAVQFVGSCRRRGLRTALATSADSLKMEGNLLEIGLPPESFDAVVTGSQVSRKKPDPEIFLAACGLLGLPAENCLVVEDAPNGVQAARAAGARCLGLTTGFARERLVEAGANWIAADLAGAPAEATGW